MAASTAERIREAAAALSFDAVGFADATVPLEHDHARYRAFVAERRHGDMAYLAEDVEARRRLDGAAILEGAKTVICLARRYDRGEASEEADPPLARLVARYARGRDYHTFLRKRLNRLARFVRTLAPGVAARALCDTAPVLERAWAARAGLGFVGKNGLLIIPGQGSFCLLGEVVTTLAVEPSAFGRPIGERCGSCSACLDACPTNAFVAPFVLDPRRCVAYATIEARSAPPEALEEAMGEHLFGCDDCQTACPYNRVRPPEADTTAPFLPHDLWKNNSLADLVALDDTRWRAITGTPARRATRLGMARNAVLVAAKKAREGDPAGVAALAAASRHDDREVAELARRLGPERRRT